MLPWSYYRWHFSWWIFFDLLIFLRVPMIVRTELRDTVVTILKKENRGSSVRGSAATGKCTPYLTSNTNNANQNYVTCVIYICPGEIISISGCDKSGGCSSGNQQYFRLFDSSDDIELVADDGSCGGCSRIVYKLPFTATSCQNLSLHEGCFGAASCSGNVTYSRALYNASAFPTCSDTVVIPDGYTSVTAYAFSSCLSLTSVTLPSSVTSIEKGAFSDCRSLSAVTLPTSVVRIEEYAFHSNFALQCINTTSSTVFNAVVQSCQGTCSNARRCSVPSLPRWPSCSDIVIIPNGFTDIADKAFESCGKLTTITLPCSIVSIGNRAFYRCNRLISVTLPSSVTSIGDSAFAGCTSLNSVTVLNSVVYIGEHSFLLDFALQCINTTSSTVFNAVVQSCQGTCSNARRCSVPSLPKWPSCAAAVSGRIQIPNGFTDVADGAFESCSTMTSLSVPSSVTSIGNGAFYFCTSLTDLILPNSIVSIGNRAFYGCASLISAILPSTITSIGNRAFSGCSSLTSLALRSGAVNMGSRAFHLDFALQCIYTTSITVFNSVVSSCQGTCSNVRQCADVPAYAFYNCRQLTAVNLPSTISSIGEGAFQYCSSLTSLNLPSGLTRIGPYAFYGSANLTDIILPSGITSIGKGAFYGCKSLSAITLPKSLTSIRKGLFYGCGNLTSFTFPDSVATIETRAFFGCTGLTSISLPSSVTSIGDYAFAGCSGLTSLIVPNDTLVSIGNSAFEGCNKLVLPSILASERI